MLFKLFFILYHAKLELNFNEHQYCFHIQKKKVTFKDRSIHRNLSFQSTSFIIYARLNYKLGKGRKRIRGKKVNRSLRRSFFLRFKCYRILNCLDEIILLLENVKSFDFNTAAMSLPSSFLRNSDISQTTAFSILSLQV